MFEVNKRLWEADAGEIFLSFSLIPSCFEDKEKNDMYTYDKNTDSWVYIFIYMLQTWDNSFEQYT